MSDRQFRLQELAETERHIAAARKLMRGSADRASARDSVAALPEPTLESARADWLTLELRRLEILHTTALPETGS